MALRYHDVDALFGERNYSGVQRSAYGSDLPDAPGHRIGPAEGRA